MQKKNSKLESFLFRQLPENKFERIRGYESCIVVSEKENKAFKYVVLGDEWVYLTENPPKTVQHAICLGDIIEVELVNDFPDFLMGDEKRNTQHLAISYWTSEPVKRRSLRKSKKSPRSGSISDLHGDRSNASTPLSHVSSQEIWSEEFGYTTQSLSSLQLGRPDSRGSSRSLTGSITKKKKKSKQLTNDTEETFLKSLKEELEEDILEDLEDQSEFGDSMSRSHDVRNANRASIRSARSIKSTKSVKSTKSNKSVKSKSSQVRTARPLPESPMPANFQDSVRSTRSASILADTKLPKKNGLPLPEQPVEEEEAEVVEQTGCCGSCNFCTFGIGKSKVSPLTCGSDRVQSPKVKNGFFSSSAVSKSSKPMSDVQIEIQSVSDMGVRRSSIQSSVTTLRGHSRSGTPAIEEDRRSNLGIASSSDYGGSMSSFLGVEGAFGEKRKVVMNLYLLNNVSPMLMLIRSAWSNYLLSSTLLLSPETVQTPRGSVLRPSQTQREKIDLLFQQLKRDLINPQNTMEENYDLLNELRVATLKNFALKKLFWKNSDLFHFFVRKLQFYLPKSRVPLRPDGTKSPRSEEFEFVTLLIEILCLMFCESEIIPDRTKALKAERGRSVLDLLMVLTCSPDAPEKHKSNETEVEKLLTDFTKTGLAAVFELFLMAKQAFWGFSEDNFLNISWMVRTLEEIKSTEKFVTRLINMMMKLISPTKAEVLSPEDAVLLYRQFFILNTFLQYSPRIRTFIRTTYLEEFKYFVQAPAIMRKLPTVYPLTNTTLPLIEQVMEKVLSSSTVAVKTPRA